MIIRSRNHPANGLDRFIHNGGIKNLMAAVHLIKLALMPLQMEQSLHIRNNRQRVLKLQQCIAVAGIPGIRNPGHRIDEDN